MYDKAVSGENQQEQLERIRERFTRTAKAFSDFVYAQRTADAQRLIEMTSPLPGDLVLDAACGPGTFALGFAPRARFVVGLDFTPAILAQARASAEKAGLRNLYFSFGDALRLPFAPATFGVVSCGYSLHHFSDPVAAVREFTRVARPGGRVALADMIVPPPGRPEMNNRIEQARDLSHTRTLRREELLRIMEDAGLRARTDQVVETERSFNHWMSVAGWAPGDAAYQDARVIMESTFDDDAAGFHPQRPAHPGADFRFVQTSLFACAEKI
jgi:ubiquinone/menaquinone biosynthesis C-methylase UbiE